MRMLSGECCYDIQTATVYDSLLSGFTAVRTLPSVRVLNYVLELKDKLGLFLYLQFRSFRRFALSRSSAHSLVYD